MEICDPPSFRTGSKPVMVVSTKPIKGTSPESGIEIHSPLRSSHDILFVQSILNYWFNGSVIRHVLSGKPILKMPGLFNDCSNGLMSYRSEIK